MEEEVLEIKEEDQGIVYEDGYFVNVFFTSSHKSYYFHTYDENLKPLFAVEDRAHTDVKFNDPDPVPARNRIVAEFVGDDDHTEYDQEYKNTDNHKKRLCRTFRDRLIYHGSLFIRP